MPALRRSSRWSDASTDPPSPVENSSESIAFVPTITPDTYHDVPSSVEQLPQDGTFSFEANGFAPRRVSSKQKKSPNHIPRPPNAFILFRSAFIRSQQVSSGVETNHSTLSKIIGLTWQQLSEEERQTWHAKAKIAQEEHKRKYPQYSFRPVHNRAKGLAAERKKLREVIPKDQERCEKIAELLACGTKGKALENAIQEYDKSHIPEVVTRFEEPVTASSFSELDPPSRASSSMSTRSRRSATPASRRVTRRSPSAMPMLPHPDHSPRYSFEESATLSIPPSFEPQSYYPNEPPSFGMDTFAFSVQEPSPPLNHGAMELQSDPPPQSILHRDRDNTLLCGNPQQYAGLDHWARSCSPLSTNSTSSMPTTPAHMNVPFPVEHGFEQPQYDTFCHDSLADYSRAQPNPPYVNDFSQYHSYSGAPIADPEYSPKGSPEVPLTLIPNNGFDESQVRTPMPRAEVDFSMFMASLQPPYSL
ncbi:hypothetical protein CPB83DRAFT_881620 [Crepidotus variabilis]|uniref:HMG box domain-containing protein n=1 Tax=Crepidotus variabilis TaxID=179855 RepID=A0A9P6EJW7_9AGAR|nr:hypothetical protein CPB83DRAFT_881620 [Crepidotus variabilis]